MNPDILAAILGIGGTAALALVSSAVAQIYFAGRLVEKVRYMDQRLAKTETVTDELVRDIATLKGRENLAA